MSELVKSTQIVLKSPVFSKFNGKSWVAPVSMQWRHGGFELALWGASLMRGVDTCTEALQPKVVDKAFGLQRFRCINHILQAGGHYIPAHNATDQARSFAMHVAQHDLSHASRRSCISSAETTSSLTHMPRGAAGKPISAALKQQRSISHCFSQPSHHYGRAERFTGSQCSQTPGQLGHT